MARLPMPDDQGDTQRPDLHLRDQGGSAKRDGADLEPVAAVKATVECDADASVEKVTELGYDAFFDASDERWA